MFFKKIHFFCSQCFCIISFYFFLISSFINYNNAEKLESHSELTFELLMNVIKSGIEEKTNIILIVYINEIIIDLKKQLFRRLSSPKKNTSFHKDEFFQIYFMVRNKQ